MSNTAGVIGSDGASPVFDDSNLWRTWSLNDIYIGGPAAQRYIPKVNDYVVDYVTDERYRVTAIDPTTLIPTLIPISSIGVGTLTDIDLLLGVGPGTPNDTYRIYIDKRTMPYSLSVEQRLYIPGSQASYAKVFRGSIINNQTVISARYNNNGELIDTTIPLIPAYRMMPDGHQVECKVVPTCNTTYDLLDNEIVVVVIYSETGVPISKQQLLVENTSFVPVPGQSTKYIMDISISSPFMSSIDPNTLLVPINVPISSVSMMGIVSYNDGSTIQLPIDGTKFSLMGIRSFVPTIENIEQPVILKYTLSNDEVVFGGLNGTNTEKTKTYTIKTVPTDGTFNVKLFYYPIWIDAINGYRLEWYMYNMDRNMSQIVTQYVTVAPNTPGFQPKAYGVNQSFVVSVDLQQINGNNNQYVFTQNVDITLIQNGVSAGTCWTTAYEYNQTPRYGVNTFVAATFVNQNLTRLNLTSGAATLEDWLTKVYRATIPLTDTNTEVSLPTPTHFQILVNGSWLDFGIALWNTELTINSAIPNFSTLFVRFVKRAQANDLHLSIAGMTVRQV